MEILKKELMELIENFNAIKIWLQLNIPRVEAGANFGVGVQVRRKRKGGGRGGGRSEKNEKKWGGMKERSRGEKF